MNSLENLITSSDSSGDENAPQVSAADGGSVTGTGADSGQTSSEEDLKSTVQTIDQSEERFSVIVNGNASAGDQLSSQDTEGILNIFGQNDNSIKLGNEFSPAGNFSSSSSDITVNINDMRLVWEEGVGVAAGSNRVSKSILNPGSESLGNEDDVIRDQYSRSLSNLELITKFADGKDVTDKNLEAVLLGMNSQFDVLQNPDPKKAEYLTVLPYWGPLAAPSGIASIETSYIANFNIKDDDKPKNYAVVVGINQYSDRRSLHTSVNDAEEMARVLKEFYGYEVILLTDKTRDLPPTKHNILEGALAEIKLKKNKGDVLVYFSGHGEMDDKGNFYLIPKDAKSNPDSYISEDELNQYTKDIKGLSLIVDACYSGGLYNKDQNVYSDSQGTVDGRGAKQLILSSSKEDEPSNEMWNETNSVFTYYLCHAMESEAKKSSGIPIQMPMQMSLQSCFGSVRDSTIRWSSSHFLSQTPHLTLA